MPSNLDNLQQIKSNLIAKLEEVTQCPKPTYSIDGQSVSWTEYYKMLMEQIKSINELIQMEDPYIIKSIVV